MPRQHHVASTPPRRLQYGRCFPRTPGGRHPQIFRFPWVGSNPEHSASFKGVLPELEVSVVPHSTAGLSDEDLAKKNISIPISNITLKLVTVDKK